MFKENSSYCRALKDYDVADENLLHFRKGEIIHILERGTQGWHVGEIHGTKGDFPEEFVELMLGDPLHIK